METRGNSWATRQDQLSPFSFPATQRTVVPRHLNPRTSFAASSLLQPFLGSHTLGATSWGSAALASILGVDPKSLRKGLQVRARAWSAFPL